MNDKLRFSFSGCPNDTFMFEAIVNRRIPFNPGFDFTITDIEELNKLVLAGIPDVSKVSYAVYPFVRDKYKILNSGSALGFGNGPLIVSKRRIYPDELGDIHMAIPGVHTTANLLLGSLFPEVTRKTEFLFSDILDLVADEQVEAGLIIHESRFTYKKKGLLLIADLGKEWEKKYSLPVPLGGIIVKRDLTELMQHEIDRLIRGSIEFAFKKPALSRSFIKDYARELSDDVIDKHIELYVNQFSLNLGDKGRKAIEFLLSKSTIMIPENEFKDIFVPEKIEQL